MSQPRTLDVLLSDLFRLLRAVGKRVRHYRQSAGLTSIELAHQTGLTVEKIRAVEAGETTELATWMCLLKHPAMRELPAEILSEAVKLRSGHKGQNGHNGVGKKP